VASSFVNKQSRPPASAPASFADTSFNYACEIEIIFNKNTLEDTEGLECKHLCQEE